MEGVGFFLDVYRERVYAEVYSLLDSSYYKSWRGHILS